jgi:hypothetical protein
MKRRAPNEHIERFRRRLVNTEANQIRKQLAQWITPKIESLRNLTPTLPDNLSDRQQDGCEPLLGIAEAAGGQWLHLAPKALLEIFAGESAEDNSVGVVLLADIRTIFAGQQADRLSTTVLLSALCELNPQWQEFSYGKPISAASLSRVLKRYGIHHRKLRLDEGTFWGYLRESFEDAFTRYLPCNLEQVEQCSSDAGQIQSLHLEHKADVPGHEAPESPLNMRFVPPVPDHRVKVSESKYRRCHVHMNETEWWERQPGDWVCERCHPNPAGEESLARFKALAAHDVGFD